LRAGWGITASHGIGFVAASVEPSSDDDDRRSAENNRQRQPIFARAAAGSLRPIFLMRRHVALLCASMLLLGRASDLAMV
jgi:hypothetical protein